MGVALKGSCVGVCVHRREPQWGQALMSMGLCTVLIHVFFSLGWGVLSFVVSLGEVLGCVNVPGVGGRGGKRVWPDRKPDELDPQGQMKGAGRKQPGEARGSRHALRSPEAESEMSAGGTSMEEVPGNWLNLQQVPAGVPRRASSAPLVLGLQ